MVVAREARLIAAAIAVGLAFSLGLTRALFAELTTISAMAPAASIGALIVRGGRGAGLRPCHMAHCPAAACLRVARPLASYQAARPGLTSFSTWPSRT